MKTFRFERKSLFLYYVGSLCPLNPISSACASVRTCVCPRRSENRRLSASPWGYSARDQARVRKSGSMLTVEYSLFDLELSACNHGHRAPIAVHCLPEPVDFSVKETLHRGTVCPQEKDANKPGKQTQYDIILRSNSHSTCNTLSLKCYRIPYHKRTPN